MGIWWPMSPLTTWRHVLMVVYSKLKLRDLLANNPTNMQPLLVKASSIFPSWCLNQPNMLVKLDQFPKVRGENKKNIWVATIWVFPKIGVPPKWMVKIMENPIKMGWFGGTTIFGNIHLVPLVSGSFHPSSFHPTFHKHSILHHRFIPNSPWKLTWHRPWKWMFGRWIIFGFRPILRGYV